MNDHIDLDALGKNSKLTIETHHSTYFAEIVEGNRVMISGGTLKNGDTRFPEPVAATIYGSTPNMLLYWRSSLVKDMRMDIQFENEIQPSIITSGIREVTVMTPDGNSYSMGWKDQDECIGGSDN